MYVFITMLVLFLVLFSSACLYMTVCIDLCALMPPVCGLSLISITFFFVMWGASQFSLGKYYSDFAYIAFSLNFWGPVVQSIVDSREFVKSSWRHELKCATIFSGKKNKKKTEELLHCKRPSHFWDKTLQCFCIHWNEHLINYVGSFEHWTIVCCGPSVGFLLLLKYL